MSESNPIYTGRVLHSFSDKPMPIDEWQRKAPAERGFYVIYDHCSNQTKIGKASSLSHRAKNYVSYWPQGVLRYARAWTRVSSATKRLGKLYKHYNDQSYENNVVKSRDTEFESKVKQKLGIQLEFIKGQPDRKLRGIIKEVEDETRVKLTDTDGKKEEANAAKRGKRKAASDAYKKHVDLMAERTRVFSTGGLGLNEPVPPKRPRKEPVEFWMNASN